MAAGSRIAPPESTVNSVTTGLRVTSLGLARRTLGYAVRLASDWSPLAIAA